MKEICTLLVKLHIIFSRMQRVNQHARPSIIQVGCPTCCYQVCALDHANVGTADLDKSSGPCHRNDKPYFFFANNRWQYRSLKYFWRKFLDLQKSVTQCWPTSWIFPQASDLISWHWGKCLLSTDTFCINLQIKILIVKKKIRIFPISQIIS